MEKQQRGILPTLCAYLVAALGLSSVALCVAAEFNRAKLEELKLDGRLCYLPRSRAFGLGIAASACWSVAQMIGNLMICKKWSWKERPSGGGNAKTPLISTSLLFLCWMSFGIGVILLGSATSMSRRQAYGKGWLDGECYVVKDGIFIGSAILALLSVASMLVYTSSSKLRRTQVDQESTVHQQLDPK